MESRQRTLKQRIALIVHNPKTTWITLICVILAAALVIGFTFIGAENEDLTPQSGVPVYNDGGIEGCFVYAGHTLYVWDYTAQAPLPRDGVAKESFTVEANDNTAIPYERHTACRLEVGTVVYKDAVYDRLYTKPGPIGSELEYGVFVPVMDMEEQWWQESAVQPGYYTYYANDGQRDALCLYFDGKGNGSHISGGMETDMTISNRTLQISRAHSLDYRIDGNVVSTTHGAYIYMGNQKPELPASSPLTPLTYAVVRELGREGSVYPEGEQRMILNEDGTGSLVWEDKTYPVSWSSDELYIDGKSVPYYLDAARARGYLTMQLEGSKVILTLHWSAVLPLEIT